MKKKIEFREFNDTKITSTDSEKMEVEGFIPYNSMSVDMGFREVITSSAFVKTINDNYDVKCLVSHDTSKVLGRVKNNTLFLESREDGLHIRCIFPDTSYARDTCELIKNDYVPQMSFGFRVIKEDVDYDSNGEVVRYLREVALEEVSLAVAMPAYTATSSKVVRGINLEDLGGTLAKEELSNEDIDKVKKTIEQLNSLLPKEEPVKETENNSAVEKNTESVDEDLQFMNEVMGKLKTILSE